MADSDTLRRPSRIPSVATPAPDSPQCDPADPARRPGALRGRPVIIVCHPDDYFSLSALEKLVRRLAGDDSRSSPATAHASSAEAEP